MFDNIINEEFLPSDNEYEEFSISDSETTSEEEDNNNNYKGNIHQDSKNDPRVSDEENDDKNNSNNITDLV